MMYQRSILLSLAALLIFMPHGASMAVQQASVFQAGGNRCIALSLSALPSGGDVQTLKLDSQQTCSGCDVSSVSTVVVLNTRFCEFATKFESGAESARPRIKIDSDSRKIVLSGADEATMRQLLSRMCEEGGMEIGVNAPIEIEEDENGILLELEDGVAKKVKAPAPISIRAIARDTCDNQATRIIEITPD
ncbi:MAG TPA: hypothetical protein VNO14_01380 [Blastocatellia bacterium]|nr:hypothetical protein [Blastocatellia bacterium]